MTSGKKYTQEEFIEKSKLLHLNKFDYSLTNYLNMKDPIIIICPKHGKFEQTPANHLMYGCNQCAIEYRNIFNTKRRTLEEFKKIASSLHENKYDYSESIYVNNTTLIKIICPIHGEFLQTPKQHLQKHGCSLCICKISKMETQWLNSLNVKYRYYYISFLNGDQKEKRYYVDGFDPETNTVYEFNGDYWHGNPKKFDPNKINKKAKKTFGQLYLETLQKEEDLKQMGYKVISIWESDFKLIALK